MILRSFAVLCLVASSAASAQDPADAEDWQFYGDLRLRADQVKDLPNRGEVDRVRIHALLGARRFFSPAIEAGVALKGATGDDRNADNVRFLDNQESDEFGVGEAWLRWYASPKTLLEIGKAPLPLALSAMTWDHDLRPLGLSLQQDFTVRTFDRISLLVGGFRGLHIDETESRLDAAQLSWHLQEGSPQAATVRLGWLRFDDLEVLAADRRGRTNRTLGASYLSEFELLNLTLEKHWMTRFGPLLAEVDLVDNRDAIEAGQGGRLSLRLGNSRRDAGWEFGAAWQRIQREAVLAAVNEDDWWFPSAMRGFMPWVAYGFSESLRLRLAAFVERRDDRPEHLKRVLLDLQLQVD